MGAVSAEVTLALRKSITRFVFVKNGKIWVTISTKSRNFVQSALIEYGQTVEKTGR